MAEVGDDHTGAGSGDDRVRSLEENDGSIPLGRGPGRLEAVCIHPA